MEVSDVQSINTAPQAGQVIRSAGSNVRKDIGVLMFLLAAETAVAGINTQGTVPVPATIALQPKSVCTSDSSSLGDTDSVGTGRTPSPEAEPLLGGDEGEGQTLRTPLTDSAVVSRVLSFVSWRRAPALRLVHSQWSAAAQSHVQIHTLPGSSIKVPFLPTPNDLEDDNTTEAALQFSHPSTWRCVHCGFWNTETRVLCGNRQCQAPSLTHVGYTRIFVGQLRRDATVPFLQWLVNRVVEAPGQLRNVENHRHNVTNRGKGCAWAYFRDDAVAQRLLAYHRRMFLDIHEGVEGVWVVPETHIPLLAKASEERGYAAQRPKSLPRNALVVEVPATGSVPADQVTPLSPADIQRQYLSLADVPAQPTPAETQPEAVSAPQTNPPHQRGHKLATQKLTQHVPQVTVPPSPPTYSATTASSPRFHHNPYGETLFAESTYDDLCEATGFPASGYGDWNAYYGPAYYCSYEPYSMYAPAGYCEPAAPPPSYEDTLVDLQRQEGFPANSF